MLDDGNAGIDVWDSKFEVWNEKVMVDDRCSERNSLTS